MPRDRPHQDYDRNIANAGERLDAHCIAFSLAVGLHPIAHPLQLGLQRHALCDELLHG
jgi:hypothetical protein